MAAAPQVDALAALLRNSRRLLLLTGAGCSTESGIPDYRDQQGAWKHKPPMSYQEFIASPHARQRYWARASIGWRRLRDVLPSRPHHALARLERAGRIGCVITQNVDGLHQRAGSRQVIDLHGRIDAVQCLHCGAGFSRAQIQARLDARNPDWVNREALMAPDGDAQLEEASYEGFELIACDHCAGPLKPAVVFFGESVPASTVARAYAALDAADALLVVGSSLMVYSGYRFVRSACERGVPVAIVNIGITRADAQVALKIEGLCGEVLEQLETRLQRC
jgi:NAD-dependent SIR2 family protein deacetylase